MSFQGNLNFSDSEKNVPDEITQFADKEEMDNFAEEFAELLNFLSEFFQENVVYDGNGNPAAVLPEYTSGEVSGSGVDANEWVDRVDGDRKPAIIKDGTLVKVDP